MTIINRINVAAVALAALLLVLSVVAYSVGSPTASSLLLAACAAAALAGGTMGWVRTRSGQPGSGTDARLR